MRWTRKNESAPKLERQTHDQSKGAYPPLKLQPWSAWAVILLSWIALYLVLALMFRATGCNRSSKAGTQSLDIVAESVGFEARAKSGALCGRFDKAVSALSRSRGSVLNGETARWSRVTASPIEIRDSEGG
jgi:hypothetical protein